MTEIRSVTIDNNELSEYDRFLLDALFQQAARAAGKPLSIIAKSKLILSFFEERQQAKRTQINSKKQSTKSRRRRDILASAPPDFRWKPPWQGA
nr:hypothetical protein Puna18p_00101 [Serratia proteamaculans]